MLSVYVVLTGLPWSASLRPDTICPPSTPVLLCLFPKHFFSRPSLPLNRTSFSPSFNILILLKNYVYVWVADAEITMPLVIPRLMASVVCSPSFLPQFIPLSCLNSLSHPVNLSFPRPPLLSPSLSPSASQLSVWCVSFCSLLLEASELTGEPVGLKTQAGVGVVAAERDGYNNPCSGSTHVLNYCHKCSSIRPRQDHQSHSAISSPDALSFSVT